MGKSQSLLPLQKKQAKTCPLKTQLSNVTWNSATPKLTRCLENVGLTITPNILFLFLALLELKFTFNSPNKRIGLNGYNLTRIVICLLGLFSSISLLVSHGINYANYTASDLVASVSRTLAFVSER